MRAFTSSRPRLPRVALLLAVSGSLSLGAICSGSGDTNDLPEIGSQLFMSPQVNPIGISCDGAMIYVANTTSGSLGIHSGTAPFSKIKDVPVGLDPVGVAVRPKTNCADALEDELVFVTNHISDSISMVSRNNLAVVQTIQLRDVVGVSQTDEPVGIVFDGPDRAFVTLDHPNQIIEIGPGAFNLWQVQSDSGSSFTAQAPRALAVSGGHLYVAAFESGNQSEFPACAANDPRGFSPGDPNDEGCLFHLDQNALINIATQSPNVGGEVIHDGDIPDRDLFVYDTNDLSTPIDTIEGVGTLLYGVATAGGRVFVTNTDARNKLDGLDALGNKMFDNRLAYVDCNPNCGGVTNVDLDANAFGVPVPTPYGIAADDNGGVLVISVAGSDGVPGDPGDPSTVGTDIPGLITVNSSGTVLGHIRTGAIPQGLALRSNGNGDADLAFVLNTVASTMTVVDVSNPAAPVKVRTVPVGQDPTPADVKSGRVAFSSARASTGGMFSCESCHPNGNIDQILWTINMDEASADVPGCPDPGIECPEPRSTMPIRGLRDTLPLHWVGNLADPIAAGPFNPEDAQSPDCDINIDGEAGCIRHLVDVSLQGVMCERSSGCSNGPAGLPGALTDAERDDMAVFMTAVAFPPSPLRPPDGALSPTAVNGVRDFFTDQGGIAGAIGVDSCADADTGCHALPLTAGTNSVTVGRFDVPSVRGIWDRHVLFSNGFATPEELLADSGFPIQATGPSEFRSFMGSFPLVFDFAYGTSGGANIWQFLNEMSVGLPTMAGEQMQITPLNWNAAATITELDAFEQAANETQITAVAYVGQNEYRHTGGLWMPKTGAGITGAALRQISNDQGRIIVVTARFPGKLVAGGQQRQPLLKPSPPTGSGNNPNNLPVVFPNDPTFTVTASYVAAGATVLVDGQLCATCTVVAGGGTADFTLNPLPAPNGLHTLQVHNPEGFVSNELPICRTGNNGSFNPCD